MEQGTAFEADIVADLRDVASPVWVFIDEDRLSPADARSATTQAIADHVP